MPGDPDLAGFSCSQESFESWKSEASKTFVENRRKNSSGSGEKFPVYRPKVGEKPALVGEFQDPNRSRDPYPNGSCHDPCTAVIHQYKTRIQLACQSEGRRFARSKRMGRYDLLNFGWMGQGNDIKEDRRTHLRGSWFASPTYDDLSMDFLRNGYPVEQVVQSIQLINHGKDDQR